MKGRCRTVAPLSGIKILSLTQFLLGPAGVQYLADMGADVIKVEPPWGAWERTWSGANHFLNGVSPFFLLAHRNVRSITLDLKRPEAQEVARRLAAGADVVVQNFRPGVVARFGLDYETLRGDQSRTRLRLGLRLRRGEPRSRAARPGSAHPGHGRD